MTGPIGLHGGGEYLPGDEPFLDALLEAAAGVARSRARSPDREPSETADGDGDADRDVGGHALHVALSTIRIVILPTAAGRGLPDRAAATGRTAFERRAAASARPVSVEVARIVDADSACDPVEIDRLANADLIHLPGGDPDLVPGVLVGSPALAAIEGAWRRGAVVAGASAGAMALAEWTWTPAGGIRGLGLVAGVAVVPHYDEVRRTAWQATLDDLAPGGIGYLGLDERTGVLAAPNGTGDRQWTVAGPGAAWWFARDAMEPLVAHDGEMLQIPA